MNERESVIFHLAFPVMDLGAARQFYVDGLGCSLGRESGKAMTLGLAGHQLVAHLVETPPESQKGIYPRHFGLIFREESDWEALYERAKRNGLHLFQDQRIRFPGTPLEHRTFFLQDPSGNLLEFKYYRRPSAIFGERDQGRIGDTEPD
jgi:extradiol dioxygenase family protein